LRLPEAAMKVTARLNMDARISILGREICMTRSFPLPFYRYYAATKRQIALIDF
jgi:hypothetical protein